MKSEMICSLSLQSEDTKVIKVVNEPNIRFEFWERIVFECIESPSQIYWIMINILDRDFLSILRLFFQLINWLLSYMLWLKVYFYQIHTIYLEKDAHGPRMIENNMPWIGVKFLTYNKSMKKIAIIIIFIVSRNQNFLRKKL